MELQKNNFLFQKREAKIISIRGEVSNAKPLQVPKTDPFLERLTAIIETHIDDFDLDVQRLCKLAAVSRSKLHRDLKKLVNMSATAYVRYVRLQKARKMILNSDFSITAIAFEVGFRNPNYFTRAFSAVFGFTPSYLRQRKERRTLVAIKVMGF